LVICLEGDDLGSVARGMGTSSDLFDEWFRERVREIHGIDLASPAPLLEQVLTTRPDHAVTRTRVVPIPSKRGEA
jgi:hypothetical protein